MGFADDMAELRREVNEMRSARMAMKRRIGQFCSDLRHNTVSQRAEFRKARAEQTARMRAMLGGFAASCRKNVGDMLNELRRQNFAGRKAFFGRHA